MDLNPPVQRAAGNQSPWVSPEQWAPWAVKSGEIDPDKSIPTLAEPDRFAIIPNGDKLGQHDDIRTINADVDNAHVISFWPLEVEWINKHVRRGGAEFVDAEIHDPNSPLRTVWNSHTQRFGVDDPEARWEQFYDEHIEPALPEP